MFVNASGLGPDSQLQVEILDEQFRPISGFAAADSAPFGTQSGFRLPATWKGRKSLAELMQPFRVRVNFTGRDARKVKLYAVYVE